MGSTTFCTSCKSNTYLFNNYCYTECPEGWAPSLGECKQIPETECSSGCSNIMLANESCDIECNVEAC